MGSKKDVVVETDKLSSGHCDVKHREGGALVVRVVMYAFRQIIPYFKNSPSQKPHHLPSCPQSRCGRSRTLVGDPAAGSDRGRSNVTVGSDSLVKIPNTGTRSSAA